MTKIQNVKRNSTEVRGNQKVTIWIQEETNKPVSTSNKPFFNSGENGILDRIADMFQTAKETIMITTPRIDDVLKDELLQASRSGVRIYVLLDADGFDAWMRNGDKQMADVMLCRQSSHPLPSLILVDGQKPNAQGLLMQQSTPLDRALRVPDIAWGLELNSEQTKMQAHYASWLFWTTHGARKETRVSAHLKSPQDIEKMSAKLIPLPENDHVSVSLSKGSSRLLDGFNEVENYMSIGFTAYDLKELFDIKIQKKSTRTILAEPGEIETGSVTVHKYAQSMAALVCSTKASGWLFDWIPDAKLQSTHQVALRLDKNQSKALASRIDGIAKSPEWSLKRNISLSELDETMNVRLRDGATAATVVENESIDLGIQTVTPWTKERIENFEPHVSKRPQIAPLTKSVNWSWTNSPPNAPKKAGLSLVERQFDSFVSKATKNTDYIIKRLETHGSKGKKAAKKLGKAQQENIDEIRYAAVLRTWSEAMKDAFKLLGDLENSEDADIERKNKTTKVEHPSLPTSDRPSVGRLYSLDKAQYLAIKSWDDFEEAEKLAKEINAELVSAKN
tara:strand:+ start:6606 stop:8294 length:1689 start_codon:yes stop_codon:yes gene_type:complete